jgi:hypothetical protein
MLTCTLNDIPFLSSTLPGSINPGLGGEDFEGYALGYITVFDSTASVFADNTGSATSSLFGIIAAEDISAYSSGSAPRLNSGWGWSDTGSIIPTPLISWLILDADFNTVDPVVTTATIQPLSNSQVFLSFAIAVASGGAEPGNSVTVAGCGLTWTPVSTVTWSGRRRIWVYRGTAASPTSGQITIDYTGAETFQECIYSIAQAINVNSVTPTSNAATNTSAGSPIQVTIGGTADTGDHTYFTVACENAAGVTGEATLTVLASSIGGANVRSLSTGYSSIAPVDQTPSASYAGVNAAGAIGFIVEHL